MKYKIPYEKKLRVAISGKSGCGNTTVSKLLAQALDINMINYTFRTMAEETGLSLSEIIEKAKTDDSFDIHVDKHQISLAQKDSCVLGSRLAIWMLKEADLKVYLLASDKIRAERILNREGGNILEIQKFTEMRDFQDSSRYQRLYKIDNNNFDFADLIIDTALHTPEQIVSIILNELQKRSLIECGEN